MDSTENEDTMKQMTTSEARALITNIYLGYYGTWEEFGYHKAKIYRLNEQTCLVHRKDDVGCIIKGIDNKYGYNGLVVESAEILTMNGKVFLRIISHPIKDRAKTEIDYFPLEVDN